MALKTRCLHSSQVCVLCQGQSSRPASLFFPLCYFSLFHLAASEQTHNNTNVYGVLCCSNSILSSTQQLLASVNANTAQSIHLGSHCESILQEWVDKRCFREEIRPETSLCTRGIKQAAVAHCATYNQFPITISWRSYKNTEGVEPHKHHMSPDHRSFLSLPCHTNANHLL